MKKILTCLALACAIHTASAQIQAQIETFPISSVRLGDSQFKKNQQADIY